MALFLDKKISFYSTRKINYNVVLLDEKQERKTENILQCLFLIHRFLLCSLVPLVIPLLHPLIHPNVVMFVLVFFNTRWERMVVRVMMVQVFEQVDEIFDFGNFTFFPEELGIRIDNFMFVL